MCSPLVSTAVAASIKVQSVRLHSSCRGPLFFRVVPCGLAWPRVAQSYHDPAYAASEDVVALRRRFARVRIFVAVSAKKLEQRSANDYTVG